MKTADEMSTEELEALVKNYSVRMRILGLVKHGIRISEGILSLLNEEQYQEIINALIKNPRLKEIGNRINDTNIEEIINENLSKSDDVVFNALPLSKKLEQKGIDNPLRTLNRNDRHGINFTTIATEDEVDYNEGALVLTNQKKFLATSNPLEILSPQLADSIIQKVAKETLTDFINNIMRLPTVLDPNEFRRLLESLSLSPLVRNNENQQNFLLAATSNFFRRDPASRKLIAEILQHHGLDKTLMENIAILSADPQKGNNSESQMEAVNYIVKTMNESKETLFVEVEVEQASKRRQSTRSSRFTENSKMAATLGSNTLLKVIEETDAKTKAEVCVRIIEALRDNTEMLYEYQPELFENGRLLALTQKLLLQNPNNLFKPLQALIENVFKKEPEQTNQALIETLETVRNPTLKLFALTLLSKQANNPEETLEFETQAWQIYFACKKDNQHKWLSDTFFDEKKCKLSESIRSIQNLIPIFEETEQTEMMSFLELAFDEYEINRDANGIAEIMDILMSLLEQEKLKPATHEYLCHCNMIFSRSLGVKHHKFFWEFLKLGLSHRLVNDTLFRENFSNAGEILLPEFINWIHEQKNMIPIPIMELALRKTENIKENSRHAKPKKQILFSTTIEVIKIGFSVLKETFNKNIFESLQRLLLNTKINSEIIRILFIDLISEQYLKDLTQKSYKIYTLGLFTPLSIDSDAQALLIEVLFKALTDKPPVLDFKNPVNLSPRHTLATTALIDFIKNPALTSANRKLLQGKIQSALNKRPEKITAGYRDQQTNKWIDSTVIDDPYRNILLGISRKLSSEEQDDDEF